MRIWTVLVTLMVFCMGIVSPAIPDDWKEQSGRGRWWRGDYKEEYWDGPCQVKIESKRGEFKREVKCKDGIGARCTVNGKRNTGMDPAR